MTASYAVEGFSDKVAFIWSVADLLRGDVRPHEFGQFILPLVVLRRPIRAQPFTGRVGADPVPVHATSAQSRAWLPR